jgi:Flp pilus assembly protein TadB
MPAAPDHDTLTRLADAYGGPLAAAVLNAAWGAIAWVVVQAEGMPIERWISIAGSLAVLWWTVERARTERAKRRLMDGFVADDRKMWQRLRDKMARVSKIGDL